MSLLLAPMEGLLDYTLRDVLTRVGGIDRCVSEFIRITDTLLPKKVFTRIVPELCNGSRTPAGVLVRPQLLGSDPVCLAENAARLAELQPAGIDLNFGCPAKTVNQHRGGAVLLDEPELLGRIVAAVRRAVPVHVPVTAKMRLGFQDDSRAIECGLALQEAGVAEIVVHARTKADGYRPPAYWERIRDMGEVLSVPLVANGEIWTVQDALRCREQSGCQSLMLGRGMVTDPGLALAILAWDQASSGADRAGGADGAGDSAPEASVSSPLFPWAELLPLIAHYWCLVGEHIAPRHHAGRLKQWLNLLRRSYPQAEEAFLALRTVSEPKQVEQWLAAALAAEGLLFSGYRNPPASSCPDPK